MNTWNPYSGKMNLVKKTKTSPVTLKEVLSRDGVGLWNNGMSHRNPSQPMKKKEAEELAKTHVGVFINVSSC